MTQTGSQYSSWYISKALLCLCCLSPNILLWMHASPTSALLMSFFNFSMFSYLILWRHTRVYVLYTQVSSVCASWWRLCLTWLECKLYVISHHLWLDPCLTEWTSVHISEIMRNTVGYKRKMKKGRKCIKTVSTFEKWLSCCFLKQIERWKGYSVHSPWSHLVAQRRMMSWGQ